MLNLYYCNSEMTATTLHITEYNKAFTAMPAAFTTYTTTTR